MIAAYPHVAFVLALFAGAAVGFITAGVLRIARDAADEDEPLSDYDKPARTRIWGGDVHNGGTNP